LFKRNSLPISVGQFQHQIATMPGYLAHPLNYRNISSYDLGLTSWLHLPARSDLRAPVTGAPEFVRSSAVPALPLVGNAFNLANGAALQKLEVSQSLGNAGEILFRLKQDIKLLDNRPLHK